MQTLYKFLLLSMLCLIQWQIKAQTLNRRFATTNGSVYSTAQTGDTVYVGGAFSQLGIGVKNLARYNTPDSVPDLTFPQLEGTVYAIEKDGGGGYYIGGYYLTNYNGTNLFDPAYGYPSAIHILSNFSIDPAFAKVYNIDYANQYILSLKKQGSLLYVGGNFNIINGINRINVAALDAATGALLPWIADATDSYVSKIEANDSLVFINGRFSNVGNNITYPGFAALKATTGRYVKSIPSAVDGQVTTICLDSSVLYIGGSFTKTGIPSRGLAQINASNSSLNYNFPSTDGIVNAVLADGSGGYYAGGTFSYIGDQHQPYLAHILSSGKVDTAFKAKPNFWIRTITTDGTNIYFGGDFSAVNNIPRNYGASVEKTTGKLTSWDPDANGQVIAMAYGGGKVYLGGYFTTVKGINRRYAAALTTSGSLSSWDPDPNSTVTSFALNNSATSVFLGGDFTTVKGISRNYLAKVNTGSGAPASWNPSPNAGVIAIVLAGSKIYAGGYFNSITGISKQYLAAIDTASNAPSSLQTDANNFPQALSVFSNKLYVGGIFTTIQDSARNHLARIDLVTGKVERWNAGEPDAAVRALSANSEFVIAGGNFSVFNAVPRNHIASIDINTYQVKSFNPAANLSGVTSIDKIFPYGSEIFAGGIFSYFDSLNNYYNNLVAFNSFSGNISRRYIQTPTGNIAGLAVLRNKLYVGGNFNQVYNSLAADYKDKYHMVSYDLGTNSLTNISYNPNGRIYELVTDGSNIITGGRFTLTNFVYRNNLAAIKTSTGFPLNWDPNVNSQVSTLAIKDTSLFAGGFFSIIGSEFRKYVCAISTKSGLATSWNADADNFIKKLVIKDTILYVGGAFTTIKGISRHYAAALSTTDTGIVRPWDPNPNNSVEAIQPISNNVYIAGDFTTLKGVTRQYLAMVNNTNGTPSSWNPAPNHNVYSLLNSGNNLYAGGLFTTIAGESRTSLAAFNTTANTLSSFNAKLKTVTAAIPTLYSMAIFGKNLYLGGINLDSVNGISRNNLTAIDTGTKKATSFNPKPVDQNNFTAQVNTVSVGRNKLFAGGNWSFLGNKLSPSYFAVYTLEPLKQDSSLVFSNLTTISVKAGVTKGSGEGRLFAVKDGAAPAAPADGKKYTSNKRFKAGNTTGTGSYVVYAGTADTVTVTNLVSNHTYFFNVYEYNGSALGTEYLQNPALSGSIKIPCPVFAPVITASGPTTDICPGKTVTLSSSSAAKYLWSSGDTTKSLIVASAGSYSVAVIDSNGCTGTAAIVNVSYTGCASPASLSVASVTASSVILNWGKITCAIRYELQYRIATGVAWTSVQPVGTGISYNLTGLIALKTYQWRVRTICVDGPVVSSSYSSIASFTTIGTLISSSAVVAAKSFPAPGSGVFTAMLYPNPAKGKAILQVTGRKIMITVSVTDIAGKIVWKRDKITNNFISLPVEGFSPGTYLVIIKDAKHQETLKLMKRN